MQHRHVLSALVLFASACTFTPQEDGMEGEFHPPLVYQHWHTEHYALQGGGRACAMSSGYNGLTVIVSRRRGGEHVSVESNRLMAPGATLTVNAGGGSFETYNAFFPPQSARALVEHLTKGGRAYLEWSEISGPTSARVHIQNMVRLDDFKTQLKQCRDSLSSKH